MADESDNKKDIPSQINKGLKTTMWTLIFAVLYGIAVTVVMTLIIFFFFTSVSCSGWGFKTSGPSDADRMMLYLPGGLLALFLGFRTAVKYMRSQKTPPPPPPAPSATETAPLVSAGQPFPQPPESDSNPPSSAPKPGRFVPTVKDRGYNVPGGPLEQDKKLAPSEIKKNDKDINTPPPGVY